MEEFANKFTSRGSKAYNRGILEITQVQRVAVFLHLTVLCIDHVCHNVLLSADLWKVL